MWGGGGDFEEEAAVIGDDEEVAVGGEGEGAGLAEVIAAGEWWVEAVGEGEGIFFTGALEVEVEEAGGVHEPDGAVLVAAEEAGAVWEEGDAAGLIDVAEEGGEPVGGDGLGAVAGDAGALVRAIDAEEALGEA